MAQKKTRKRVKGKIAGLCCTYIAKLAGVAPVTVRRFVKANKGNVTHSQLRRFIFEAECRRLSEEIKNSTGIDFGDRLNMLLQREGSK